LKNARDFQLTVTASMAPVVLRPDPVLSAMTRTLCASFAIALCVLTPLAARAQEADLTKLTLEDLLDIEVTSVAHKAQTLARTAAAVYVISQEDIRRSGARSIPELLRMVPGFTVARIDDNSWSIGSRGFAGLLASKLLVLIDGRSVYTPMFAGVHWEMQNVALDDIDRIEVIRGPGGTIWGANAVNGVVNVITKDSADTQGTLVHGVSAADGDVDGYARYGAAVGRSAHLRVFGRAFRRGSPDFAGFQNPDLGDGKVGGARVDWAPTPTDNVSFNGSVQSGQTNHMYHAPNGLAIGHVTWDEATLSGSWSHASSSRSETTLHGYFDGYSRPRETWRIGEMEIRHRRALGDRHDVTAGGGYRGSWNQVTSAGSISFTTEHEQMNLVQAFAQDEVELSRAIHVTPGVKLEHNGYTGLEVQPSLRGVWQPAKAHMIWAAASHAVRTPTRAHRTARLIRVVVPVADQGLRPMLLSGSPTFASETLDGVEAGYRFQTRHTSVDLAIFRNGYNHLLSAEPIDSPVPSALAARLANGVRGNTTGGEVAATWTPRPWLKLFGSYAGLSIDLENEPGSHDTMMISFEENGVPRSKTQGRVYLDLPKRMEFTAIAYHMAMFPRRNVNPFVRADLRLGWRATSNVDFAVGVQDAFTTAAADVVDVTGIASAPPRRSAFAELRWSVR
jgi:iron complex outermembrane recepter protein